MDWPKAVTLGITNYLLIFMAFSTSRVFLMPRGSVSIVLTVAEIFIVLFLAYYYFRWTGIDSRNEGLKLGALWLCITIVLEYLLIGLFIVRETGFTSTLFWIRGLEQLLIPWAFTNGLLPVFPEEG